MDLRVDSTILASDHHRFLDGAPRAVPKLKVAVLTWLVDIYRVPGIEP